MQGDDKEHQGNRPLPLPDLTQRCAGGLAGTLQGEKLGAVFQLEADVHGDKAQRCGDQERHAPGPFLHHVGAEDPGHAIGHGAAQQQAEHGGDHQPAGRKPASTRPGVFGDKTGDGADFTARRKALHAAHQDQQDRRRNAQRRVGRQHAEHHRRAGHHHQRHDQGFAAADLVRQRAEEQPTQRPDKKAQGECGKAGKQAGGGIIGDEKRLADVHGEKAVDAVVVPLDQVAGGGTEKCTAPLADRVLRLIAHRRDSLSDDLSMNSGSREARRYSLLSTTAASRS